MRRLLDTLIAYAIVAALIAAAVEATRRMRSEPPAEPLSGIVRIVDGDTLAMGGRRLRLLGIDAPELAQTCGDDGGASVPCGARAAAALRALAAGGLSCTGHARDVYGRTLATCSNARGDIGAQMVAAGQAVADGCCRSEEDAARAARRGIWSGPFEWPADWRRAHREGRTGDP